MRHRAFLLSDLQQDPASTVDPSLWAQWFQASHEDHRQFIKAHMEGHNDDDYEQYEEPSEPGQVSAMKEEKPEQPSKDWAGYVFPLQNAGGPIGCTTAALPHKIDQRLLPPSCEHEPAMEYPPEEGGDYEPRDGDHGKTTRVVSRLWWRVLVGRRLGEALQIVWGCGFGGREESPSARLIPTQ
jgi:hypothetical protein